MNKRLFFSFKALLVAICPFVLQCSSLDVVELRKPVKPLDEILLGGQDKELEQRVYGLILQGRKLEKRSAEQATGYYLEAAQLAYGSSQSSLRVLYSHACGQVADLIAEQKNSAQVYRGRSGEFQLKVEGDYRLDDFIDLIPVDCLKIRKWPNRICRAGVGSAMVATYEGQRNSLESAPFVSRTGGEFPLTAVLKFPRPGMACLQLLDSSTRRTIQWGGESDTELSCDYSASLALAKKRKLKRAGVMRLMGVFRPLKYSNRMGLYVLERFDPEKIPVIFVHGLVSSPATWLMPMNSMMSDEEIRQNYAFYTFYYPTGIPVRVSSAELKREIHRLYAQYRLAGAAEKANEMVLVGHSMGGLLSSIQVREFGDDLWTKISRTPLNNMSLSKSVKEDMAYLINGPRPSFVKRVIFISTPHRGSNMANNWFGQLISSLIKLPENIATLRITETAESLTDLGKTIFSSETVNSMVTLKADNPVMELVVECPIAPSVTYHSIIGDRGKGDTPHSSDGVVDYSSSHLTGAASEMIVPAGHSAHSDPQSIEEVMRILRLHLESVE